MSKTNVEILAGMQGGAMLEDIRESYCSISDPDWKDLSEERKKWIDVAINELTPVQIMGQWAQFHIGDRSWADAIISRYVEICDAGK